MDEKSNTIPLRTVHDPEDHRYVDGNLHVIERLAAFDGSVPDAVVPRHQVTDRSERVSALYPGLVHDVALLVGDLRAAPRDQRVIPLRNNNEGQEGVPAHAGRLRDQQAEVRAEVGVGGDRAQDRDARQGRGHVAWLRRRCPVVGGRRAAAALP